MGQADLVRWQGARRVAAAGGFATWSLGVRRFFDFFQKIFKIFLFFLIFWGMYEDFLSCQPSPADF